MVESDKRPKFDKRFFFFRNEVCNVYLYFQLPPLLLLLSSSDSSICFLKASDTMPDGFSCLNRYRSLHLICHREMLCFVKLSLFRCGFPDTNDELLACFCPLQYLQNTRLLPAPVDVEVTAGVTIGSLKLFSASDKSCEETLLFEPSKSSSPDSSFSSSLFHSK